MGMLLKLLCPGDVPAKAHKMIMNDTTNFSYEQVCLEKHHAFIIYSHWNFDGYGKPLVDNTTNQLIEDSRLRIWGEWDRMVVFYEILLRKGPICLSDYYACNCKNDLVLTLKLNKT